MRVRLAQNQFRLLIPVLVLDLALVGKLPPPPGAGHTRTGHPWLGVGE